VFTADYYVANPDAYLGKEVTLSVSSLNPRNEQPLLEAAATPLAAIYIIPSFIRPASLIMF
jgi:hypothetical protein